MTIEVTQYFDRLRSLPTMVVLQEDGQPVAAFSASEWKAVLPQLIEVTGYGQADATAQARTGESYDG